MFLKTHLLKTLILFFSVNFVNASVSIDSTRNQITKHLVNRILYEKKQVEKKLKLIKSTADAEKLYLDFEDINARLINKLRGNEIYLMSCMSMHDVDFKKLPDSLSNIVKTVKKANIRVIKGRDNPDFSFELDYELKIFKNFLAPDFKAYLEMEYNACKNYNEDDHDEIYLKKMSQYIIESELFLKKFKKNNWQREEVKRTMRLEFQDYILGNEYFESTIDNKFTPILKKEHQRFIKKYPKSKSIKFLKQIIIEFKKNKNRRSLSAYFDKESYVFMNQFN